MRFTLDWNCIIEVEEQRAQSNSVLELVAAHRKRDCEVALLAASASENNGSHLFPGNASFFHARVTALGWDDLPIVPMPAIMGLSYWDFAYYVADGKKFEKDFADLWGVIAPNIPRSARDNLPKGCELTDGSIQSKELRKWRNHWCDVMSAYSHIHAGRDVFVTNNTRDFQKHHERLAELGMRRIATPEEALSLLG